MKILIADDSEFIRVGLKKLIKSNIQINHILTAESVSKAIEIINIHHPDFVIIDISFPESNGFEILKVAKQDPANKLAIILTNYPSEHTRAKSFEEGADYFYDKSEEFDNVVLTIKKFIRENLLNNTEKNTKNDLKNKSHKIINNTGVL